MIAYTITAPLANGTSYERTESGSNSFFEIQTGGWTVSSTTRDDADGKTYKIQDNGGESRSITYTNQQIIDGYVSEWGGVTFEHGSGAGDFHETVSPEGLYSATNSHGYTWTIIRQSDDAFYYENGERVTSRVETRRQYDTGEGHVMATPNAPKDSDGNTVQEALYATYTYNGGGGVAVPASLYFWTYASQTTTKTTVTNYGKVTTTTQEKLAKVGTTITQSVGTSVVTLPTTTNAKSWTENKTTNTTATEDATVVTTSMGIDSYWKKTAHTVYILGKGETAAFLKSDVALNATNGGPTDTAAYDTYSGPTTFTITRVAGTTSQNPVVADTATDTGFIQEEGSETTVTIRGIAAANSTGAYFYPGWPGHFPLSSANITIQTGASESSTTQLGWNDGTGSWGANAQTTTRSAWSDSSVTYSLAGVSYTEGVPTHTEETYARPTVRSGTGSFSNDLAVAKDYFETEIDGEWVETFSTSQIEGVTGNEGGANGFGEQANYFVNFQNQSRQNNGGGADAFYGLAYAWGTLGGTTATPRQSISVDGIASSESVTWPFVSISAGVQTPKPFVTVSQIPATSKTSSTAATKTEITTRRIWGEEFAKTTSSRQTASTTSGTTITGTSGSTTTPIEAGGAAITSFQLGGARGFPVSQLASGWIPSPAMFVVGGIAQANDSTAIIPPGEYANSTITAPQTFSGSSIANTYFLPKAAVTYLCYPS
jgi:hypothetical protein